MDISEIGIAERYQNRPPNSNAEASSLFASQFALWYCWEMSSQQKSIWPYPPGHLRHGEPKEPSAAAVWRMLSEDHGIPVPTVKQKIKGEFSVEVGDYDFDTKSFPVWLHVPGAAYPEKYAFETEPLVDPWDRPVSTSRDRPRP